LKKYAVFVPGLIVCLVIALLSILVGKYIAKLGAGTLAILIGILAGNAGITKYKIFKKGIVFSESILLYWAIILMGGTMSFHSIAEIGSKGVLFILLQMSMTIIFALWLGSRFSFSEDFRMLMASGNAVCGSSAIAATAPAINADDKSKGLSITMVNLTGTVMMLLLPLLTGVLYHQETERSSALIGGVLQSVGQVVASGSIAGHDIKEGASIFKIVRILFLVVVIAILAKSRKSKDSVETNSLKMTVPWYIIGFFLLCGLNSFFQFPYAVTDDISKTGHMFEVMALAGIGLSVRVPDLMEQGAAVSLYAVSIAAMQVGTALILIFIFFS
jgi:uncharacterized integral membrane protein (TIGR00698 family)